MAQKEFEEKIRKLENQLSQVRVKEAQAEAASAMSNVAFKVGDLGDTMKTVEDALNKRYEMSAGKARLAKDMVDTGQLAEKESERKAALGAGGGWRSFWRRRGLRRGRPARLR